MTAVRILKFETECKDDYTVGESDSKSLNLYLSIHQNGINKAIFDRKDHQVNGRILENRVFGIDW